MIKRKVLPINFHLSLKGHLLVLMDHLSTIPDKIYWLDLEILIESLFRQFSGAFASLSVRVIDVGFILVGVVSIPIQGEPNGTQADF